MLMHLETCESFLLDTGGMNVPKLPNSERCHANSLDNHI